MSAPEAILTKIKLLLNLTKSPNANEADNAQAMVNKLVDKYSITEAELKSIEDKPPLYGEENKLFHTLGLVGWRQQLALAVGKFFFCQIVQEEIVPLHGVHEFTYYVYGESEDEDKVKFAFHAFAAQVEDLIKNKCVGRGPIYVSSYGEGVIETIKNNIYWEGIDIPKVKEPSRTVSEEKVLNNGRSNLSVHKEEKEKPVEQSVDVNTQSMIKDINAYFRGIEDAKDIHLGEILELEAANEEAKKLAEGSAPPEDSNNFVN